VGKTQQVRVLPLKENWQSNAQLVLILVEICLKDGSWLDLYCMFDMFLSWDWCSIII
jgi:hypothetical protein